MSRKKSILLLAQNATVYLPNEWLEAFWCEECEEKRWYYIKKKEGVHMLLVPLQSHWKRTSGTAYIQGNPSVSEFSRRESKRLTTRRFYG